MRNSSRLSHVYCQTMQGFVVNLFESCFGWYIVQAPADALAYTKHVWLRNHQSISIGGPKNIKFQGYKSVPLRLIWSNLTEFLTCLHAIKANWTTYTNKLTSWLFASHFYRPLENPLNIYFPTIFPVEWNEKWEMMKSSGWCEMHDEKRYTNYSWWKMLFGDKY